MIKKFVKTHPRRRINVDCVAAGLLRRNHPSESTGKALATWVRSLGVTERDVDPNHGWRHRFKTDGRFAEVGEDVISALQGHAIAGMSGRSGEFPARVTSKGIAKLPRIDPAKLPDASGIDLVA